MEEMEKGIHFSRDPKFDFNNLDESLFEFDPPNLESQREQITSKPYKYWFEVGNHLIKSKVFLIFGFFLFIFVLLTIFAPLEKTGSSKSVSDTILNPSWHYVFGTGNNKEDFWITIWLGTRTTYFLILTSVIIQLFFGLLIGLLWGYGYLPDFFFRYFVKIFAFIPRNMILFVIIFLNQLAGHDTDFGMILFAISIGSWAPMAKVVAKTTQKIKSSNLYLSSITIGTRPLKIFFKTLLPNLLPEILRVLALTFVEIIAIDTSLAFFKMDFVNGDFFPTSLGYILRQTIDNQESIQHPHLIYIPIIAIILNSLLWFFVINSVANALDSKNHKQG